MAAYVIVEVETVDEEAMARYREMVPSSVAKHGGRFIVRGGAVQTLEGNWAPPRVVVLAFPNARDARAWWESAEYREAKELRQRAGRTRMILVEGVP